MLTFIGCQTAPQPEQKRDVSGDTKAINALTDLYTAAHNSNDAAADVAIFADDGIVMLPDQPAIAGWRRAKLCGRERLESAAA
jgi:ketosteroid isomerase-like protein